MSTAQVIDGDGTSGSPQAQLIKSYGNIGFGGKKDTEWYMRAIRSVELMHNVDLTIWYNTKLPIISQGGVVDVLEEYMGREKAFEFVNSFIERINQLYFGPGIAYLVSQSRSSRSDVLYSTVGWMQLKYPPSYQSQSTPDGEVPMVRANIRVERMVCPHYKRGGGCRIYEVLAARGPSVDMKRSCEKCRKKKEKWNLQELMTSEYPEGVSMYLFEGLRNECRKQLETLSSTWVTYAGAYLSQKGDGVPAAPFDTENVGKMILESDSNPNENWQAAFDEDSPLEHIRDYGGDYLAWLKATGKDTSSKVVIEKKEEENEESEYRIYDKTAGDDRADDEEA